MLSNGYGDGWGDVNLRVNLHGVCTLITLKTLLGLDMGMGGVMLTFMLTCTLKTLLARQMQLRQRPLDSCPRYLGAHLRKIS